MIEVNLSDLQNKEVIDIASGRRIGAIIDVIIDRKGNISKLILEDRKSGRRLFTSGKEDIHLNWNQIIRIGDDIILVNGDQTKDILNHEKLRDP